MELRDPKVLQVQRALPVSKDFKVLKESVENEDSKETLGLRDPSGLLAPKETPELRVPKVQWDLEATRVIPDSKV